MAESAVVGGPMAPVSTGASSVVGSTPARVDPFRGDARATRRATILAGVTVAVLLLAQAVVVWGDTWLAEVAQIGAFVFLAIAYLAWPREPHRQLLLAFALLPLVQLLSLSLPTRLVPTLEWFVLIGVPVYAMLVLAGFRLGLRPAELGLRRTRWQPQARIVLIGAALAAPGYLILRPTPLVADPTPLNVVTAMVIVAIFGGLLEEGLFRGVIQAVGERSVARRSIVVSAFATGLLYSATLDVRYIAFAVLVGILFSTVVRRTGSLVGVGIGHAALLSIQLVLLPALFG